ncbi:uncharacterized protein LOC107046003 isoform X3 [Diachasma alloeum]|uniref:uncharacterized protein LOC107046003 isoform X3 n=1 Tax=Diachasma alloeum TaxID=454923 RepID=UPI0007382382|nr:uncharacterized protein LOC107046003 isoform X3 [Diachasma alloeum]
MEGSAETQASESPDDMMSNPRPRKWGEDLDDSFYPASSGNNAIIKQILEKQTLGESIPDGVNQEGTIKVKDLNSRKFRVTITVQVRSVHPGGMIKTKNGRHCLAFTVGDETGEIKVMAWEEVAIPLSNLLEVGQSIKIMEGHVESSRYDPTQYLITLSQGSTVEVDKGNGETYVVGARGCQPSLVRSTSDTKLDGLQQKRLCLSGGIKKKVSALTSAQNCDCIELEVKTMLTNGVILSSTGKQYLRFIGNDDTGEICCSVFEPHSRTVGPLIQVGVYLQLKNIKVKAVNTAYSTFCNNDFEIVLYSESRIEILEEKTRQVAATGEISPKQVEEQKASEPIKDPEIQPMEVESTNLPGAIATAAAGSCLSRVQKQKINELTPKSRCICIELQVAVMLTDGVATSCGGRKYVRFIGSDDTGEICCSIFEPHSLTVGPDIQANEQKISESIEQPVIQATEMKPNVPTDEIVPTVMTLADIIRRPPHFGESYTFKAYIGLEVKCFVFPELLTDYELPRHYILLIGKGAVGEICCSIYNPHKIAGDIKVGTYLKMKDGQLKAVDHRWPMYCDNPFEIVINGGDNIEIVRELSGSGEDRIVNLDYLDQLEDQNLYDFVDVLGVLCRFENLQNVLFAPLPAIVITDSSRVQVPIIFARLSWMDRSLSVNTIVKCCNLQVRKFRGNYQLHFVPGKSRITQQQTDELSEDDSEFLLSHRPED